MAAPTVYEGVAEDVELEGIGQLFAGKKFFVAMRCPSRNKLLDDIRANGGEIVPLEKNADYLIADHFRRDAPPGSISYEFIQQSIRDGALRDPADHPAGPALGATREVGSISRPAKGGRRPYTSQEDILLYKWVRDAEKKGGLASGNAIYKELEQQHPQHTWQSWRDHYLKVLKDRPPSAFNIPDNAPPSPPSDQSEEQVEPIATSSRAPPKTTSESKTPAQPKKIDQRANAKANKEYTVNELAELFSTEDWEELYAFVHIIDENPDKERYKAGWTEWAKHQENQTAEQWRQYYEKIVRPQWASDPQSKRDQITKKIEQKHRSAVATQSQALTQEGDGGEVQKELETQQGDNLLEETVEQTVQISTDVRLSSSTARPESPQWINDMITKAIKRSHGEELEEELEQVGDSSRPIKRRKSASVTPIPGTTSPRPDQLGTQAAPLQISSAESTSWYSQTEDSQPQAPGESIEAIIQEQLGTQLEDSQQSEYAPRLVHAESDDFPSNSRIEPLLGEDDPQERENLPSNTSTPRAKRMTRSNFDTQAILSSPSQELPQPFRFEEAADDKRPRSLSPARVPESDSTTQSLQEFRRSLNAEDAIPMYRDEQSRHSHISPSPAPSSTSSTGSGDPDVPLEADEMDDFFEEQHEEGFDDAFIVAALRRTRCRPDLAIKVLAAWKEGKPLPNTRGIWSLEDDEAVESGDGLALAMLERKHTLDGWGGITERLNFLEAHRNS